MKACARPGLGARARPDVVYHLAAQIDVRRSVSDPLHDARVNVLGTIALAMAALEAGCRRLVFASSGGTVYGEPDPSALPIDERYPPRVTNPYGVSKRSAEDYLLQISGGSDALLPVLRDQIGKVSGAANKIALEIEYSKLMIIIMAIMYLISLIKLIKLAIVTYGAMVHRAAPRKIWRISSVRIQPASRASALDVLGS